MRDFASFQVDGAGALVRESSMARGQDSVVSGNVISGYWICSFGLGSHWIVERKEVNCSICRDFEASVSW